MEQEKEEDYIDHSSELGKLILQLNKLEKKPSLDNSLGEILESFMRSLRNSGDFLRNGIFKINFAEAALVLQSSASIYTKKVDLLWDTLNECQKRMLSLETEENKNELERIEERERKYKRRRKSEVTPNKEATIKSKSFHVDWEEMKNFQPTNFEKDSKLYSEWHKKMVRNWDLQPTQRINSLVDKQVLFRSAENAIFDKDQDNEFVSYTSKMESAIGLEELLLSNKRSYSDFCIELYMKLHGIPRFLRETSLRYEDLEEHSVEFEKYVAHYRDQYFSKSGIYDTDYYESLNINKQKKLRRCSVSTVVSMQDMPDFDNIHIKTCQVNVLRLSVDDLGRLSVDELKKACGNGAVSKKQNFQENFSTNNIVDASSDFPDSSCCIGTKTTEEHIDIAPKDNHDDNCERQNSTSVLRVVISKSERRKADKVSKIREKGSGVIFERIDYKTSNGNDLTRRITEGESIHKIPAKKRLSKIIAKTITTSITVDSRKFESFYASHYEPEEGERYEEDFSFDDPIDCSSRIGLDEDRPLLSTQDSGYESNYQYNEDNSDYDIIRPSGLQTVIPTTKNFENDVIRHSDLGNIIPTVENCENDNIRPPATNDIIPAMPNCGNDIIRPSTLDDTTEINQNPQTQQSSNSENDETPLFQRVYEWKQFMSEKFKTLKSADFNIHEYGSNIMENFQDGRPQKFSNIVGGKSSSEVTRYFLSALQLANTNNIEINGVQSGKLSNETFELKLITKDRYYDKLKDYMAPSEQNYHDRLSNVIKLKKRRAELSSSGSSSCKRNRFE